MSLFNPEWIRDELEYRAGPNEEPDQRLDESILNVTDDQINEAIDQTMNDSDWGYLDMLRSDIIERLVQTTRKPREPKHVTFGPSISAEQIRASLNKIKGN